MIATMYSGKIGIAFLSRGDSSIVINVHNLNKIPVNNNSLSYFFDGVNDVCFGKFHDEGDARKKLIEEYNKKQVLMYSLSLFDDDYSQELKHDIMQELEALLVNVESFNYALFCLVGKEFCRDEIISHASFFDNVSRLFSELLRVEPFAKKFRSEWSLIVEDLRRAGKSEDEVFSKIEESGALWNMCYALTEGSRSEYNTSICTLMYLFKDRDIVNALLKWVSSITSPYKLSELSWEEKSEADETDHEIAKRRDNRSVYQKFTGVQSQIKKIEQLIAGGDIERAKKYTDDLIGQQESIYAVKSLCNIAQIFKKYTYFESQLELCQKAVDIAADGWSYGQLGDAYFDNHLIDEANRNYKLIQGNGDEGFGIGGQARVLRAKGRYVNAIKLIDDFFDRGDKTESLLLLKAENLISLNLFDEAKELYNDSIALFPDSEILYIGASNLYCELGEFDKAFEFLDRVYERLGDTEEILFKYAHSYKLSGNYKSSMEYYQKCLEKFPDSVKTVSGIAEIYMINNDIKRASALINKYLQTYPNDFYLLNSFAKMLKYQNKISDAIEYYFKIKDQYPYELGVRVSLSDLLKQNKEYENSLREYSRAIEEFPGADVFSHGRADLLKHLGYYDESLNAYDEIITLSKEVKSRKRAILSKVSILIALNRLEEAEILLPEVEVLQTSNDWFNLFLKGMLSLKQQSYTEAKKAFLKGKENTPFPKLKRIFGSGLIMLAIVKKELKKVKFLTKGDDSCLSNVFKIHSFVLSNNLPVAEKLVVKASEGCTSAEYQNTLKECAGLIDRYPHDKDDSRLISLETGHIIREYELDYDRPMAA